MFPLESNSAIKSDAGSTVGYPDRLNARIGLLSVEVSPRVYVNVTLAPLAITPGEGEIAPLPLVKETLSV